MKVNYNLIMEEIINGLNYKPKLLLHACCGVCSSSVLERLSEYFDITVLYYNPNIYPKVEFGPEDVLFSPTNGKVISSSELHP